MYYQTFSRDCNYSLHKQSENTDNAQKKHFLKSHIKQKLQSFSVLLHQKAAISCKIVLKCNNS